MNVWCEQMHIAKPRSSDGEWRFSEAAAGGAGQRRKATRPNMQPAPRPKSPRTSGKQALPRPRPLTRNEKVWLPTTWLNGSSIAWLYIILRNCWLKKNGFPRTPSMRKLLKSKWWVPGMLRASPRSPPAAGTPSRGRGASWEKLRAGSCGERCYMKAALFRCTQGLNWVSL